MYRRRLHIMTWWTFSKNKQKCTSLSWKIIIIILWWLSYVAFLLHYSEANSMLSTRLLKFCIFLLFLSHGINRNYIIMLQYCCLCLVWFFSLIVLQVCQYEMIWAFTQISWKNVSIWKHFLFERNTVMGGHVQYFSCAEIFLDLLTFCFSLEV